MLNKNDVVPLYVQLERMIRGKIASGEYKEGEAIPSEAEMTKQFQITRTTVRKAVLNLVNEGLLNQVHGKGTFVSLQEVKYNMWNFGGFSDYVKNRGEIPVAVLLENKVVQIDGQDFLRLKRARGVKKHGTVLYLSIDTSTLSLDKYPNINGHDFEKESLYDILRTKYNVDPQYSEIVVTPVKADANAIKVFNVDQDTYLLNADVKVSGEGGDVIETVEVVFGPSMEFKMITKIR